MKHGNKAGIFALAIYLAGVLLLIAITTWRDSPIQYLENFAFLLAYGGLFLSIYAGIRGSRWWLLLPASNLGLWLWLLLSGNH